MRSCMECSLTRTARIGAMPAMAAWPSCCAGCRSVLVGAPARFCAERDQARRPPAAAEPSQRRERRRPPRRPPSIEVPLPDPMQPVIQPTASRSPTRRASRMQRRPTSEPDERRTEATSPGPTSIPTRPLPEIVYDLDQLPEPVRRMHDLIVEACQERRHREAAAADRHRRRRDPTVARRTSTATRSRS